MPFQRIRGFSPLSFHGGKVGEKKKGLSRRLAGGQRLPRLVRAIIPKSQAKIKSEGGQGSFSH